MNGARPPPRGRLLLLRKFLRHGTRVASVAPSSRALAAAMSAGIDPARPQVVVELGAGTGAVTAVACARMHPDSRLVALEIDPDLAAVGRRAAPAATWLVADVAEVASVLGSIGVDHVDVVLSGLPVPSLPRAMNAAWIDWLATCAPDAPFHQVTVMPWVYRGLYRRVFESVAFTLVLRNVPPGGVYRCQGLRAHPQVPGPER